MEFANPNVLWGLLAVPVLVMTLVYDNRRRREDLEKFTGPDLAEALAPGRSWRKNLLKGFLKTTGFALLLIALAGPRFGSQLVKVEREGVDLVIALDTSLSMLAEDMLPNRLERAKQAIVDLIRGLKGDRVGIVVFAGDSFALCPLTVDYDAALMFTRSVGVDVVSEPGT
ncbi:MAG: VWA domain-containing protein, partial [Candidatus Krumholzibacteria bacterium]|nr:VWA domain-containing protein [Candidatus Krumholzibacteria bacterium]